MSKENASVNVETFTASIYVGRRMRYSGAIVGEQTALEWLQKRVDEVGLCVTFTPTTFIYTNGSEPGFIVGLINYPRFPSTPDLIRAQALDIAKELRAMMGQLKVTVVFPDVTTMVTE